MNDVMKQEANVLVKEGSITFQNFEMMEQDIMEIARQVKEIEVTEETVKVAKKKVTDVRKGIQALETMRKETKKRILAPYQLFESQVKTLVAMVDEADEHVRSQIRELEEKEREQKKQEIIELWNKRNKQYEFTWLTVDSFLKPGHLNKTVTMTKVEEEMVQWFEETERAIRVIESLPHSMEVLAEYKKTGDVAAAMEIVDQRKAQIARIEEAGQTGEPEQTSGPKKVRIEISDCDFPKVVKLLQENNVNFEVK